MGVGVFNHPEQELKLGCTLKSPVEFLKVPRLTLPQTNDTRVSGAGISIVFKAPQASDAQLTLRTIGLEASACQIFMSTGSNRGSC